jgi:hypothetical protein
MSGTTSKPVLHYARPPACSTSSPSPSPLQQRFFDLRFQFYRAPTWEHLWATVEEICALWDTVEADRLRRQRLVQLRKARGIVGLERSPKREAAADFMLLFLSHGARRWPELEMAGVDAGHSRKTLRNARDCLRDARRLQRTGTRWELKTSDA